MHVVLIGNYIPDRQQSMQRFAYMLQNGFTESDIDVSIWYPTVFFAKGITNTMSGIGKWLGYIDKWVIFPIVLWGRVRFTAYSSVKYYFHICDHSNAPYLKWLPAKRTVITCHDVLAIRGAMGYTDAYCPASGTGKILQRWILNNLIKAKTIAVDSLATLNQLQEISSKTALINKDWRVIYIAFNAQFSQVSAIKGYNTLREFGLAPNAPFILHVGSNLPRKNRAMLLNMVSALGDKWGGQICFAGQSLNEGLMNQANSLGLSNRIISVPNPDHTTLLSLYSTCQALIFPSFSEGFGWPVIEAQACGAPVIASNIQPMPEVSGGAALFANPKNPQEFADAFLSLNDEDFRANLIQRGFENCRRFDRKTMIEAYLDLYSEERNGEKIT